MIETPRSAGFELRHLRYFVALAEERNFERAASRLRIAQPGLSQQILKLEAILGVSLLDRSKRLVRLTAAGEVFFAEAKKVLAQSNAALTAVTRTDRGESGRISIGYVASAAYSGALVGSISSFRSAHPHVELQLTEMEMRQQLEHIRDGVLDFGYIRPPIALPDGIATTIILREPMVVALAETHELANAGEIDLAALSGETFITPRQPSDVGFHSNTIAACREAGFQPAVNPLGRDFTAIGSMVALGLGIALVPKSLDCLRLPAIAYVPISKSRTTSDLAVAYRKTETSPAIRALIAHCRRAHALPAHRGI
ncbi:LysR family transcriptional regulator [Phyllobacterium leguminum]|uniref:LysR family transcriptional regulator n=2 Tax=Phyllobacterium leguminum TaxID=314237 RepID=A0A318T7I5_9HYPH|nr:LysR family transcriptional regulator [Phyllobacterium leguminum]